MVFSLVLDVLSIGIVVLCIMRYYRKGFGSGIINLIGGVASLALSGLFAKSFSNWFFDNFYKTKLEEMASQTIQNKASDSLSVVDGLLDLLPSQFSSNIKDVIGEQTEKVATSYSDELVDSLIGPLVLPVIEISVFAVFLCLFIFLFRALSKLLISINAIPVLGGVNQILGAVVGGLIGILILYIIFCILWVISIILNESTFSTTILPESYVYKLFEPFNVLANMFQS